jgi:hypothetical protein
MTKHDSPQSVRGRASLNRFHCHYGEFAICNSIAYSGTSSTSLLKSSWNALDTSSRASL